MYSNSEIRIPNRVAEAIKEGYSKLIGDKVNSMESYSTLTDSIYETILHSDDEELCKAKDIIMGIERRNLPKFVGEITISQVDAFKKRLKEGPDFVYLEASWNYGKKDKNPLDYFGFYTKHATNVAKNFIKMNSTSLPQTFEEHVVYIYSTGDMEEAKRIFDAVAQEQIQSVF
ncbi:deoxynucleoside triphosphate triphosphohydrolase SAMHD1-like [Petromyzon marinus]|uniref:deoxynucleoside triphosphate triphosphohydrolase SAMHD1-like n=1 Tax=Petromyzon marinus TaxID=7757 RepID=UPI003F71BDDB